MVFLHAVYYYQRFLWSLYNFVGKNYTYRITEAPPTIIIINGGCMVSHPPIKTTSGVGKMGENNKRMRKNEEMFLSCPPESSRSCESWLRPCKPGLLTRHCVPSVQVVVVIPSGLNGSWQLATGVPRSSKLPHV